MSELPDMAWLDDPRSHLFVEGCAPFERRCFACGQPEDEHSTRLIDFERRMKEIRDQDRRRGAS